MDITKCAARGTAPIFAFGHGLCCARFSYDNVTISGVLRRDGCVTVHIDVTNPGDSFGVTVVQNYQRAPQDRGHWHRLVGFAKLDLPAHGHATARIPLTRRDLSFRDSAAGQFALSAGGMKIGVGTSSAAVLQWVDLG